MIDFSLKKLNEAKLIEFGFKKTIDGYVFSCPIMSGQLRAEILVTKNEVKHRVFDEETGDEFTLYRSKDAVGKFVGSLREEVDEILSKIYQRCFDDDVFKSAQAKKLIKYIEENYGARLEFLWPKFPRDAIWRRGDNQKWFGLIMTIEKSKLGLKGSENVEVIDVRAEDPDSYIDNVTFFKAYHMNKKSWLTVILDGGADFKKIANLIDKSFILAAKK